MSKPKIKGLTSMYLATLQDTSDPLMHGLVKMLATLDPKFEGQYFTYEPEDVGLFLSQVDVIKAIAVSTATGIVSFTGYPLWVQADSKTAQVPVFFPNSVKYDSEGDPDGQKTFEEWVTQQGYTLYEDGGKFFAGAFKHGLDFAALVVAEPGYELLEQFEAAAKISP